MVVIGSSLLISDSFCSYKIHHSYFGFSLLIIGFSLLIIGFSLLRSDSPCLFRILFANHWIFFAYNQILMAYIGFSLLIGILFANNRILFPNYWIRILLLISDSLC